MTQFRVSSKSAPGKVASAIIYNISSNIDSQLLAIGAGATSQAIKAVAIARDRLEGEEELYCVPSFFEVRVNGRNLTAIKITVKLR